MFNAAESGFVNMVYLSDLCCHKYPVGTTYEMVYQQPKSPSLTGKLQSVKRAKRSTVSVQEEGARSGATPASKEKQRKFSRSNREMHGEDAHYI